MSIQSHRSKTVLIAILMTTGVWAAPAVGGAIEIETVPVDAPGNPPDSNGLGSVSDSFRMAAFEMTNTQYVAFLNAVAADDTHDLYDELMTDSDRGGILRSGAPGAFSYSVKPLFENKPVNATCWLDAARFCNWLHNGQPVGSQDASTTEFGAYDMSLPIDQITRLDGAVWFIPTHDEWYKAAYYDPFNPAADAGGTQDYWLYPTQSDSAPSQANADDGGDVVNPGPNVANHSGGADWHDENGNVTTVGGCMATSPWGVFDMGGNVIDWTEDVGTPIPPSPPDQPDPLPTRIGRGGDFANPALLLSSPIGFSLDLNMIAEAANIGIRVATIADGPPADLNGDGSVGPADLALLLGAWGACGRGECPADLNGDGSVGPADLAMLLGAWG